MAESAQILLDLDPRRPDRFEDFVTGPNSAAVGAVKRLLDEPGQCLFLHGPTGSGKSHLLNALCHQARQAGLAAYSLALKHVPAGAAEGLAGLDGFDLVCIDDIDRVAGQSDWELALFHCFNAIRRANGRLAVSSAQPLNRLAFGLPDLASRLAWGVRLSSKKKRGSSSSVFSTPSCEKIQLIPTKLPLQLPPPSAFEVSRNVTSLPNSGLG